MNPVTDEIIYANGWDTYSALEIYRRYTNDDNSESLFGFVVAAVGLEADETWTEEDHERESERIDKIKADLRMNAALEAVECAYHHPKTVVSVNSRCWRMTEIVYDDVRDIFYLLHPEPGEWDEFLMEYYTILEIGRALNLDWFNEEP